MAPSAWLSGRDCCLLMNGLQPGLLLLYVVHWEILRLSSVLYKEVPFVASLNNGSYALTSCVLSIVLVIVQHLSLTSFPLHSTVRKVFVLFPLYPQS